MINLLINFVYVHMIIWCIVYEIQPVDTFTDLYLTFKGHLRSKILIDHKGPNWTFLILKMTFRMILHLSYFRTGLVSHQRIYMMP